MKILTVTSRSVTLELENTSAYYAPKPFDVLLNGQLCRRETRNVFSLFSLTPGTCYQVAAGEERIAFTTRPENCCLDVRQFRALGDGVQDDTPAFTAAIACLRQGGPCMFLPEPIL